MLQICSQDQYKSGNKGGMGHLHILPFKIHNENDLS